MSQDLGDEVVTDMHGLSHGKGQKIKQGHTEAKFVSTSVAVCLSNRNLLRT